MPSVYYAISIFCDIRGSTRWQRSSYESQRLSVLLLQDFDKVLAKKFTEGCKISFLGDGFFIAARVYDPPANLQVAQMFAIHKSIESAHVFSDVCARRGITDRACKNLRLGWGISCGVVEAAPLSGGIALVGPSIVIASRCCDAARPFGIVIDAAPFAGVSAQIEAIGFHLTKIELKDLGICCVYTYPATA